MLSNIVKKALVGLVAAIGLLGPVAASPPQQEKQAFCETVAKNYKAGADAKKLGMDEAELESRIVMFAMGLIQQGMPDPVIKMLVKPIVDGYFGQNSAMDHFNSCMKQELI